jgi:tetratricopeptide (TPR) repeat protein
VGLLLAVLAAYANHFDNDFHFDDFHTVNNNPYIHDLRNIPYFFTDAFTFSNLPDHATWRPLVSTSLAIDFWLGHGLKHFPFQFSNFFWFAVQLVLMFLLFRKIMDVTDPHPSNIWTALAATAFYGLHPACAETVNYVIQRGDLYSTLGIVASLWLYAAYPEQRKNGWYILPAVAAYLSKAPALIYPFILLAYIWLFEGEKIDKKKKIVTGWDWNYIIRAVLPLFLVTVAATILTQKMTPAVYNPGAMSPSGYRITQPWIALHYFKVFFLPTDLSADTDWGYVKPYSIQGIVGFLFVIGLIVAAWHLSKQRRTRPIAFGIIWFILALIPTAMLPLAEVTNDHRMFFPFVGLVLSVFWGLRLVLMERTAGLDLQHPWVRGIIAGLAVVMTAEAAGTHHRNEIWHTETSLWKDVTEKSPKNGRGWMNYAITFIPRDYTTALRYLTIAEPLVPDYYYLHLNMGIVYAGLNQDVQAEKYYRRATELNNGAEAHVYYAFWLKSRLRLKDAQSELEAAVQANPKAMQARHILMQMYFQTRHSEELQKMVGDTLALDPRDPTALQWQALVKGGKADKNLVDADAFSNEGAVGSIPPAIQALLDPNNLENNKIPGKARYNGSTPETMLNISKNFCEAHNFEVCLAAAKQVLDVKPNWAPAYNNIGAAYVGLQMYDEAIQAFTQALQLKPDYKDVKDNLQYAQDMKRKMMEASR